MKNIRVVISLNGILLLSIACQPTSDVNTNTSTADINTINANLVKASLKESSPGAADATFDLQFLDTMSAHHQSAINMAKLVAAKSENPQLKTFAAKIIGEQSKQIEQMKNWRAKWFSNKPTALLMEMPGMLDSMKGRNLNKLQVSSGTDFDLRFIEMMMQYHRGAIVMSNEASTKAEHSEIKALAEQIAAAEEVEIKQMQDWKTAWSK